MISFETHRIILGPAEVGNPLHDAISVLVFHKIGCNQQRTFLENGEFERIPSSGKYLII